VISMTGLFFMPPMRAHLDRKDAGPRMGIAELLAQPMVPMAWAAGFFTMMSAFILVPNFASYLQGNLGYPREHLGVIYLIGGTCGFIAMRIAGPAVDRLGPFAVAALGICLFVPTVWLGFGHFWSVLPIPLVFCCFWFAMAVRNVSFSTLASRVPRPQERARFMSITSACQHMAGAIAAFMSSMLLTEGPGGVLIGMERIAAVSIVLALAVVPLMLLVERRVKLRETAARQGQSGTVAPVLAEG
jgi:predicted MFS family arabinose efflux permease